MSSAVLYLAIVAVWGVVLVPMWLRRDGDRIARFLHRRGEPGEPADTEDALLPAEAEPPARRGARAAVIARRRRRTLGLALLLLASAGAAIGGVAPWWFAAPPSALFGAHLWLLRVAAKLDADRLQERRARIAELHAAQQAPPAEEEPEPTAEVIELPERHREDVYDQYTDRRAVGH